jgi:hypothetical protein
MGDREVLVRRVSAGIAAALGVVQEELNMSDAFSSVSLSDLDSVHGGQQPPAATPAPSALQVGGKLAKKIVPVLKAADAADGAVTDYQKTRAAGDNVIQSMGSGGLGALDRLTWGASNWLLGRK